MSAAPGNICPGPSCPESLSSSGIKLVNEAVTEVTDSLDAADTADVADAAATDVKLLVFEAAQADHDDDALSSASGEGPGSSL